MNCGAKWITPGLALFCGTMTFFLVRSEFFPESSLLQQVPPRLILEKILRNETVSALKIEWKDEEIGSLNWRVAPGSLPVLRGTLQCVIPVLGQRPKLNVEMMLRLRSNREVERFRIQGRCEDVVFQVHGEPPMDRVEIEAKGPGFEERRTISTQGMISGSETNSIPFQIPVPIFKDEARFVRSLPSQTRELSNTLGRFHVTAADVKLKRVGEEVDAYLINTRLDENTWAKFWIGLTGEFLKMDSSFGLRAVNVDYFEGPGKNKGFSATENTEK